MTAIRVMPHDIEAEAGVLGGIMNNNAWLKRLSDLRVDDFYNPKHQAVFVAMRNLEATMVPIDPITIEAELSRQEKLESIGGMAFLGELSLRCPSVENVQHYAAIVVRRRVTLSTIEAASEIVDTLTNPDRADDYDGEAAVQYATARIARIETRAESKSLRIGAVVNKRLAEMERIAEARSRGVDVMTGAPTGVPALDKHLGGVQFGIVSIVAARPAMGKSALCMGIADASSEAGLGSHVFSLEDSLARYADRTLARHSLVPPQDFAQGTLTRGQLDRIRAAITRLRLRQNWILDPESTLTAGEIVRAVRRDGETNNTKVVVVDYVQLVKPFDRRAPRHEQLDEIVTTFSLAAKADDVAYVVASQLNRKLEERPDKRPTLADLKESGALEERCKTCVMLYRGSVYGPPVEGRDYPKGSPMPSWGTPESEWEQSIELLITKNTPGQTGYVAAKWNGPLTMIT